MRSGVKDLRRWKRAAMAKSGPQVWYGEKLKVIGIL